MFFVLAKKEREEEETNLGIEIWNGQYFNSREGEGGEALKRERIQCQPTKKEKSG